MADSIVSIALQARNLAGGAVNQLISQIGNAEEATRRFRNESSKNTTQTGRARDELGRFVSTKDKEAQSNSSRLRGLSLQAGAMASLGLATAGVELAIQGVTAAWGQMASAASQSANLQIERVGAINTAMETLNLSNRQATEYYQGVEKQIAQLGKDLPVSVDQIQQIYRTLSDDFTGQLQPRGATPSQLADLSVGASARLAVLAQQGNVATGNALSNISSFLGGAGVGELRQQTLFQNNPRFFNAIKEGLEKYGSDNRAEVLSRALEQVVTDQQIASLQGTVTAQVSSFMDRLFDPTIGIFSLSRDLDSEMSGYQSVFEEFGTTIDILIGQNGIFDQIGQLTGIVNFDPMLAAREVLIQVNNWLFGISNFLSNVDGMSPEEIGAIIGEGAAGVVNNLMGITLDFIRNLDVGAIGGFVLSFLRGLGVGLAAFFATLDFSTYASLIISPMGVVLVENLVGLTQEIADNIVGVFTMILDFIVDMTAGVASKVGGLVAGGVSPVANFVGGAVNNTNNFLGNAWESITSFFTGFDGFIPANDGLMSALDNESRNKPPGTDFVIANSSEYILTPEQFQAARGVTVGEINISLNLPQSTPQEIAREAIALIENALTNELSEMIA